MTVSEAIEQFLTYVKSSQSQGTARAYSTGLRHFKHYLQSLSLPPDTTEVASLTVSIATGFVAWLYEYLLENVAGGQPERISEATKGTYFASVSRFFEYLIIEAQLLPLSTQEYDTLRKVLTKAAKSRHRDELPPDKLPSQQIIQSLRAEAHKPIDLPDGISPGDARRKTLGRLRNIAVVEALLSSGMRVGELVRLERGHLLYEVQGALVKYAKGKKDREVLFSPEAWSAIQAYLRTRDDSSRHGTIARLTVFARHDRRAGNRILPISTRSIQNILYELAASAGILERFRLTPHTLRHYFATEFLSETGDLALTQYALGHASPTTTRIYAQTKRTDYRRAHRRVFDAPEEMDTDGTQD